MFEIKYFFSAGVSNSEGEGISSKSVKEFIKELVEEENPEKPLSDQKMVELLEARGFNISEEPLPSTETSWEYYPHQNENAIDMMTDRIR